MAITICIAQAVGIGGAFWLSGNIAALSLISAPAILRAKADGAAGTGSLTRLWRHNYELGKSQNPPVAVLAAGALGYLAWTAGAPLYGAAAALTLGIVPYTIVAMRPTNGRLIKKSEDIGRQGPAAVATEAEQAEVDALLGRWVALNGVRSVLPALGGVAAVLAAVM
ncbi:hypothetical protein B0J12DRAFT_787628 [Macrophomina phaseolina]|uniref:DUF1772 domain-containing protein n=1 Tax=Macrophomina phaseolina TaxID=35725 RepID=A0ABQ8G6A0_9PEZI|nr:hypothetical protein B0J12DRAFT_787628 [Macrophomina phaseolina]